jgi:hypothetical protein
MFLSIKNKSYYHENFNILYLVIGIILQKLFGNVTVYMSVYFQFF